MAEIQLTDEQQRQMESLTTDLGQDAALRDRFQADPRAVLGEYGIADILPADLQFEARASGAEVGGFAMATIPIHWDFSHVDTHLDMIVGRSAGYKFVSGTGRAG
jgi:hypothetical protein